MKNDVDWFINVLTLYFSGGRVDSRYVQMAATSNSIINFCVIHMDEWNCMLSNCRIEFQKEM